MERKEKLSNLLLAWWVALAACFPAPKRFDADTHFQGPFVCASSSRR